MSYTLEAGGAVGLPSGATLGGTGQNSTGSTYSYAALFNGTLNSQNDCWGHFTTSFPKQITITFSSGKVLTKYGLWPRTNQSQSPKNFEFRGSNDGGTNYTTLDTRTNITSWATMSGASSDYSSHITNNTNVNEYTFTNTTSYTTYILHISSVNNIWAWDGATLGEIALYSTFPYVLEAGAGSLNGSGGAQGVVTDTYNHSTTNYQKDKAFDGDTQYRQGAWVPAGHSLTFQFPSAKTITMYRIWLAQNRANWTSAKDFTLQGSNDGSSFTTVDTVSNRLAAAWPTSTTTSISTMNSSEFSQFTVDSPGSYTYYRISVTAVNNTYTQNWFGEVAYYSDVVTVPDAPTNLAASVASNTSVNLSWTAPSGTVDSYKIENSTDNSSWTTIVATHTSGTTYTNTGLTTGATYYYRVSSTNSAGTSAASSVVNVVVVYAPTAPTNVGSSSITHNSATLSWTASSAGSPTGYKIERSLNGSSWTVLVANTGSTAVTLSLTALSPSTQYYHRVSGINANGTSPASSSGNFTTSANPNAAPSNLSVATPNPSATEAVLSWTASSPTPTSYTVSWSPDNALWHHTTGVTATTHTLTGIYGILYFKIKAVHSGGDSDEVVHGSTLAIPNLRVVSSNQGSGDLRILVTNDDYFSTGSLITTKVQFQKGAIFKRSITPDTFGGHGKLYVKSDDLLYYKSTEHGECLLSNWNVSGTDYILGGNLSIGSASAATKALSVTGNVLVSGATTIGLWSLPSSDGSANQVLQTDGSGVLSWVALPGTGGTAAGNLTTARSVVYDSYLSSESQNARYDRFYCWNDSANSADLAYTRGTTQGANSLFHVKTPGQYLISYILKYDGSPGSTDLFRTHLTTSIRTYTGQTNNTTRGTLRYEYHVGNWHSRGNQASGPSDKMILGGTIRLTVTTALANSGFQLEIRSDNVETQAAREFLLNQTESKIRIERYTFGN